MANIFKVYGSREPGKPLYLIDDLEQVTAESSNLPRAVILSIDVRFSGGSMGRVRPMLSVCYRRDDIPISKFAASVDRQRGGKLKNSQNDIEFWDKDCVIIAFEEFSEETDYS